MLDAPGILYSMSNDVVTNAGTEAAEKTDGAAVPAARVEAKRRHLWLLDLLIFLVLFGIALPPRFAATSGDLWFDEADYTLASTQGFAANRTDNRNDPKAHRAMLFQRHFHPPLTVYIVGLARQHSVRDRDLRVPFVLLNALTVGLVYLCGLPLFGNRREIAIGAAVVTLAMPLEIQYLSHVIPWPLITACLMALLWTLLNFAQEKRPAWLAGTGILLGLLFTASEMFFPTVLIVATVLAVLIGADWRDAAKRRDLLKMGAVGLTGGLAIVLILWPVGLTGDALEMIRHYVGVAGEAAPVHLAGKDYEFAPKWAYLYYFWSDYKSHLLLYAGGLVAFILLGIFRKLSRPAVILLAFTVWFLLVAHRAHILGPQYLVHCVPMLSLLAGLGFLVVSLLNRPVGMVALIPVCAYVLHRPPNAEILDADARARVPRWPVAAPFLKSRWQSGDKLLVAPQKPSVVYWYLKYAAQMPVREADIRVLPQAKASPKILQDIATGTYRYIIISSTFAGDSAINPQIRLMLNSWPMIYKSDESGSRASRLKIYERPAGLNAAHPQKIPAPSPVVPPPDYSTPPTTEQNAE